MLELLLVTIMMKIKEKKTIIYETLKSNDALLVL